MMKTFALTALAALTLQAGAAFAEVEQQIEDVAFSFEGPFGTFDEFQLQRGLQVYTEVCSACHGLKYVPIRTLADEGGPNLPEDQVRAYATGFTVLDENANRYLYDAEKDEYRALKDTDNFPVNTTAKAPDLSLMAKSRAGFRGPLGSGMNQLFKGIGGPEYIASILTGYTGEEKEEAGSIFYENTAFAGGWIAMAPPLSDELVTYQDGHEASLPNMAEDVSAFLMWSAEPKMMARKQVGFLAVFTLTILSVLLYLVNKQLWAPHKRKHAA